MVLLDCGKLHRNPVVLTDAITNAINLQFFAFPLATAD